MITRDQAKRFILIRQGLLGKHRFTGKDGAYQYVRQAGCIQYDPVDVCGKNAELTLQSHGRILPITTGGRQMEFRKVFDTIPEQFDKYRPRYSKDLFDHLIKAAGIGPGKVVLELGPGTGQATDPILRTGCDYNAIELGEHLYAKMQEKYGAYPNFHIVNDDFITHDFGTRKFNLIYSAATIQWIPEKIAFSKTFDLLKSGGFLAMMYLIGDYKTPNEDLYRNIQKVYDEYFKPTSLYMDMREPFDYLHVTDYGYTDLVRRDFHGKRVFTADEYVLYCGTHSDHMVIPEPYKTKFFEGLRNAVIAGGNKVEFWDTYVLYLAKKP